MEKKAAEQAKKEAEEQKKAEIRKKEIMYIRHRIQKTLLDKSGKEPDVEVSTPIDPIPLIAGTPPHSGKFEETSRLQLDQSAVYHRTPLSPFPPELRLIVGNKNP